MAFIPSRIKKHDTDPGRAKLNLNSMMDMFTIILIFLLITYSTDGQLISPSKHLTLPKSSIEHPAEVGLNLIVSKQVIMVNDEPVAKTRDVLRNEPGIVDQGVIKPLQKKLKFFASHAKRMETQYGVKFSGKVTIQADRDLQYAELVKIMRTCGLSDYPNMRLVVYRKEQ